MSKKKYLLLLLIPVILIAAFMVVNYKPLSLAVEYYNTNYYNDSNALVYVFITQQNCNQKEYYFEKFLYNPYRYLKKYI